MSKIKVTDSSGYVRTYKDPAARFSFSEDGHTVFVYFGNTIMGAFFRFTAVEFNPE